MPDEVEDKDDVMERLKRERRWYGKGQGKYFKDRCFDELHQAGIWGAKAQKIVWDEIRRRYPPLPEEEEEVEEEVSEEDTAAMEKMLENVGTINWVEEIRWVYLNLGNKGVRREHAPNPGAWNFLEHVRKFPKAFFDQLLPKALAKDSGADTDVEKREAEAIEDITDMLRRLAEAKDDE